MLDGSDGRNRDQGLADTPVLEQNSQVNQNLPSARVGRTIDPNLNAYGDLNFDWAEYVRNHVSKTVQSELNKHIASHAQSENGIESLNQKINLLNVSNSNLHIKRDYKLTKSSDFDYSLDYLVRDT